MACLDGQALYMVEFTIWRTDLTHILWEAFVRSARVLYSPDNIQNSLGGLTSDYVQRAWESPAATPQNLAWYCADDFSLDAPNWMQKLTQECGGSSVGIHHLEYNYCSIVV